MAERTLTATKREISNKGAVNKIRRDGYVPGIFYSNTAEPIALTVHENAIKPFVFTKEKYIVNLEIEGGENYKALLKDVQFEPVTDKIIHFDLLGLSADHLTHVEVPVKIVGASAGVKAGGHLETQIHKVTIECLPIHIPEHIEIDITDLEIGQSIHISDLKIDNIKFITPAQTIIVLVSKARGEA